MTATRRQMSGEKRYLPGHCKNRRLYWNICGPNGEWVKNEI